MNNYLMLASKYQSAHSKKTRLAIISVAISVALITGIFSMVDVFMRFEKLQVIHEYGNYHLAVINASADEISAITNRVDVKNSGRWIDLGNGRINSTECRLGALDEAFAGNLDIKLLSGQYPKADNEIMLEKWAAESLLQNEGKDRKVNIVFPDNTEKEFYVSGIYNDMGAMKAKGIPGVMLAPEAAVSGEAARLSLFLVEFKDRVKINKAVADIKKELSLPDNRVELNNHLLAVIGQSEHNAAVGLYTIGVILFFIVLLAGIVMIYNTFNISVMERVRQFGLLRCVGASKTQIKKLVRKEGLSITLKAIPLGIFAGIIMTFACSAVLKFFNNTLFGTIPLFSVSIIGISAGIIIGFLTVFMASLFPARRASRVPPVNAVSGSNEIRIVKSEKKGILSKLLRAEIAMGINSAFMKRKTLFLMSCSIALSIIMFLGFNVFINFMYSSLKTTKPYTPDISLAAEKGIPDSLYKELSELDGVKRVYGRRLAYINAAFDADSLTDTYRQLIKEVKTDADGLLIPAERSWLISYDRNQLKWARADLFEGELSEEKLNEGNGVIAVAKTLRKNRSTETVSLKVGDKVFVDTEGGRKELTVMGVLDKVPFSSKELIMTTFITTEAIYESITGDTSFKAIDIQLKRKSDEGTVSSIKKIKGNGVTLLDSRQQNSEINQLFLTMAVFVYGFVTVIAIISILNIINTMNTSVAAKTRYLGVLRAVGMSGRQLNRMVLAEAAAYGTIGSISGIILGILLQRYLIYNFLASVHVKWSFPAVQVVVILVIVAAATVMSVINPLKRIREKGISEVVNSL